MRKLDYHEFKSCQFMGRVFEKSLTMCNFSSPMFIRRFMNSDINKLFSTTNIMLTNYTEEEIVEEIIKAYPNSESSNRILYSQNEMYWIGYIYLAIAFLYNLTLKNVYKLINANEIRKKYPAGHTFDIEEAAERIMEGINYQKVDYMKKGTELLRRLYNLDKIKALFGNDVELEFDDHETINAHLKKNIDSYSGNEVYFIGNKNINNGKIIGYIDYYEEQKEKLIVSNSNCNLSSIDLAKILKLDSKKHRYKIVKI